MILSLQVKPNSKIDQIYFENGQLKVKIRAQPVDGKANEYLREYLASVFQVAKSQVNILKGSTSRFKQVEMYENEEKLTKILEIIKS